MGRIYTVVFVGTLTAAGGDTDLVALKPADDKPIKLRKWTIGQTSEVGDTAEENIRISLLRLPATVTDGSGGSSVTPQILGDSADSAAGFTARCNDTTVTTTSGTASTLYEHAWNERNVPCEYNYLSETEQSKPKAKQGEALVLRIQTTVADDISIVFTAEVEEE